MHKHRQTKQRARLMVEKAAPSMAHDDVVCMMYDDADDVCMMLMYDDDDGDADVDGICMLALNPS